MKLTSNGYAGCKGTKYSPANGDKDPEFQTTINTTRTDFDELLWHDARLIRIHIDRSEPGHRDDVLLAVQCPDTADATILFKDVYAMRCELNFGVIADETILSASQVSDSIEITRLRERWQPAGVVLDDLKCFEFETASTASRLQIYARRFEVS